MRRAVITSALASTALVLGTVALAPTASAAQQSQQFDATGAAHPAFVLESSTFMHVYLPAAGSCPAGTAAVYRVFSNRPDANHRYMTDRAVRDRMVALGWLAEGDGPDLVVMCSP